MNWRISRPRHGALAIWLRNLRVWRKLIGPAVLMNFGEPTIYLIGLGFGLGHFVGEMDGMPYLAFLASGIMASSAMTTASFEGMYSVFTRMETQRSYDALLATPLEIEDILAGEALWCGTKSLFSGTAILLVAFLIGVIDQWQALLALPVVFLAGLCFAGPAMMMSAIAPNYDFFTYYFVLLVTPMFMLCGVFYPISTLPEAMQGVVQILPLTHVVALTRPLTTAVALDNVLLHLGVLAGYSLAGFYGAVVLMRRRLLV